MIAPIHLVRHGLAVKGFGTQKGAYLIGKDTHTDYLNFIYNCFDPQAAKEIFSYVQNHYGVKTFFFDQLVRGTEMEQFLLSQKNCSLRTSAVCVEILPRENWEEYKKSLHKSVRQNLRTAMNRAEKDGILIEIKEDTSIDAESAQALFDLYSARVAAKNTVISHDLKTRVISAYYKKYNENLHNRLVRSNYLTRLMQTDSEENFILRICANNIPMGFCYGRRKNQMISVMIVSFDQKYARYSPGMVGIFKYLESCYAAGQVPVLDLTRGNEKYKYDLGGIDRQLQYYTIQF